MRTLLVGNTGYITNEFIEEAFPEKSGNAFGRYDSKNKQKKESACSSIYAE